MTFVEREICENCGHHFRTGVSEPGLDAKLDEGAKHRTMQFTLPPMPMRLPPKVEPQEAPAFPMPAAFLPSPRRRLPAVFIFVLAALALAAVVAAVGLTLGWRRHAPAAVESALTPVGAWESALTSRASGNARLSFYFFADGSGTFAWQESGAGTPGAGTTGAAHGQSPLRWHQGPNGLLTLAIAPAPLGDAVSGTMIAIFNSHAWLWHVDRPHKRLMLGNLAFTEK